MEPGQPKSHSRMEALCGTLIGFSVGVLGNWWLLPLVGTGFTSAVVLTFCIAILSCFKNYAVRRLFNWYQYGQSPKGDEG